MRPDAAVLRPSSHFKKLSYDQVCALLDLLDQVDATAIAEDKLDAKEKDARDALLAIRLAMEDKRAQEDAGSKRRRGKN